MAACTFARANSCCAPKVCGYHFVDNAHANQPGSTWQHKKNVFLDNERDGGVIVVRVLRGDEIGSVTVEFV